MSKNAIITNADNVCGSGIARKLAEEKYNLALSYANTENSEELQQFSKELEEKHKIQCYTILADFSKKSGAKDFVEKAKEKLGSVDLMCNNPIPFPQVELEDIEDEELDNLLTSEMRSWIILNREAGKAIFNSHTKGSIVNISSIRSRKTSPGHGLYAGFTAGLNHMTHVFANEMGTYGIRVNSIETGFIKPSDDELRRKGVSEKTISDMNREGKKISMQRAGAPEDVGDMVVFLASEKASYVTGACIPVDGGLSLPGAPTDFGPITDVCTRSWGIFYPRHLAAE